MSDVDSGHDRHFGDLKCVGELDRRRKSPSSYVYILLLTFFFLLPFRLDRLISVMYVVVVVVRLGRRSQCLFWRCDRLGTMNVYITNGQPLTRLLLGASDVNQNHRRDRIEFARPHHSTHWSLACCKIVDYQLHYYRSSFLRTFSNSKRARIYYRQHFFSLLFLRLFVLFVLFVFFAFSLTGFVLITLMHLSF